jgi:DNA replication and repair protein RecF
MGSSAACTRRWAQFTAVIFLPQMTRIIEGGPEDRRRYLNLALAQVVPGYSQALSEYGQAITSATRCSSSWRARRRPRAAGLLGYAAGRTRRAADPRAHRRPARAGAARRAHPPPPDQREEVLRLVYQPAYDPVPQPEGQFALPLQTPVNRTGFSQERIRQGFMQRLAECAAKRCARRDHHRPAPR